MISVALKGIAAVGGSVAWLKRVDTLLAPGKYKSSQRHADVAPGREIPLGKTNNKGTVYD